MQYMGQLVHCLMDTMYHLCHNFAAFSSILPPVFNCIINADGQALPHPRRTGKAGIAVATAQCRGLKGPDCASRMPATDVRPGMFHGHAS